MAKTKFTNRLAISDNDPKWSKTHGMVAPTQSQVARTAKDGQVSMLTNGVQRVEYEMEMKICMVDDKTTKLKAWTKDSVEKAKAEAVKKAVDQGKKELKKAVDLAVDEGNKKLQALQTKFAVEKQKRKEENRELKRINKRFKRDLAFLSLRVERQNRGLLAIHPDEPFFVAAADPPIVMLEEEGGDNDDDDDEN
jgi:hypothetical protein